MIKSDELLKEHAVSAVLTNEKETEACIQAFGKEYAKRTAKQDVLGEIKRKLHYNVTQECQEVALNPADFAKL